MRLALTLLLLLLVSCAETPSKPTTSGGASSGSGKVVTAAPEEPYECDSDLILEPHLPEECIPPEPPEPPEPVVQKPVEPPKVDPIVGTYRIYFNEAPQKTDVLRVYSDNTLLTAYHAANGGWLRTQWRWKYRDGWYDVYWFNNLHNKEIYRMSYKLQKIPGEPDLVTTDRSTNMPPDSEFYNYEAIKVSDDPSHLFDLYELGSADLLGSDGHVDLMCFNVGNNDMPTMTVPPFGALQRDYSNDPKLVSESLAECESLCKPAIAVAESAWKDWSATRDRAFPKITCPQDRR